MLNSLLKVLFAISSLVIFSSDNREHNRVDQNDDFDHFLEHISGNHNHADGEACGFDIILDEMIKKDPDLARRMEEYQKVIIPQLIEEYKANKARNPAPAFISIPVVYHVVHKSSEPIGTGQNLPADVLHEQLETLNEDFAALNSGWENTPARWADIKGNPEMVFCLAEFDPNGAPTDGIDRYVYDGPINNRDIINVTIKNATSWDSKRYYNIWTVPIPGTTANGGVVGWAYFPFAGTIGSNIDGCVLDYRFTGRGNRTLTHEVGHSFGLYHTFQGGCGGDDGIADTPQQGTPTSSLQRMSCNGSTWPEGPKSCNGIEHMYINYMDYSPDACATTFTEGQVAVMRGVMMGGFTLNNGTTLAGRAELAANAQIAAPSCSLPNPPGGGGGNPPDPDPDPIFNDAGIRAILSPEDSEFCSSEEITPVVLLTNDYGETTLTSCVIKYKVKGIPGTISYNWTGALEEGETEEVTLATYTSPNIEYSLTVWTDSPNGAEDENGFNDEKSSSFVTIIPSEPNVIEDFEPTAFAPSDKDITRFNPNNDRTWERTTSTSAYGLGNACTVMRNYLSPDPAGREDWLITPLFDFSAINNPRLTFDVASIYVLNISEFDTLEVRVSTDCGETFPDVIWQKGGQELSTSTKGFNPDFIPTDEEWRNEKVSLTNYEGIDKLYVALVNKGYKQNNIYIDNLNLAEGCAADVSVEYGDVDCGGECTGFINLNLTGFEAPGQITWSDGGSQQSLDELCAGDYSVTIIDPVYDCEFIEEITITEPIALFMSATVTDEILFPNSNSGTIDIFVDGGTDVYTFEWSDGADEDGYRSSLAPGTYCVTVSDTNGCSLEECYEIKAFACDVDFDVVITYPECGSGGNVSAEVILNSSSIFGYFIIWSPGFVTGPINNNLQPGQEYTVFVTELTQPPEDRCDAEQFVTAFDPNPPSTNPNLMHESNAGAMNGGIDLNTQGDSDYTYAWDNGGTTESIADLSAGFYTVTITDVNTGCTLEETHEILVLNCDIDIAYELTEPDCFNGNDGSISVTVSGGNNPTTSWEDADVNGLNPSGLSAGTYTIIVEDNDGCRIVEDIFLSQPGLLDIDFTTADESAPGLQDASIDASVTGGTPDYMYVWSNGATTSSINGLGGGTYTVTVTDGNGCTTVKGATVTGLVCPDFVVDAAESMPDCFEASTGSIVVTTEGPIGPLSYAWSDDNTATSNTRTDLPAGEYEVTITDAASGCTFTSSYTIDNPEELSVLVSGTEETLMGANDGTATATGAGGTGTLTYLWNNGETTATISGLAPGEYCVDVTDENECTINNCYTVNGGEDPCLTSTLGVDLNTGILDCNINQIDIVATDGGGSGTSTYQWSDGSTGAVLTVALPGPYTVVVTDELGCTTEATVEITQNIEEPTLSLSAMPETTPSAADGTVEVIVSNAPNATYEWTDANGNVVGTTATVTDLAPGTYCVVVTNTDNGCSDDNCIEVLEGSDPCANTTLGLEVLGGVLTCVDEEIDLVAMDAGGQGSSSYLWSTGEMESVITVTEAGTYSVVVTDELGCSVETSVEVDLDAELPFVTVTQTGETNQGANDGTATATTFDDLGQYPLEWFDSNGNSLGTDPTITNLAPGEYCVVVTSLLNGCTTEECITITGGSDPCATAMEVVIDPSSTETTITCLNEVVVIEAQVTGGTMPYEFLWNTGGEDSSLEVTAGGEYSVIITDANGCTATNIYTVDAITNIPEINVLGTNESSSGAGDGSVTAMTTETGVTYEWTNAAGMVIGTDATLEGLEPGEYCVEVMFTATGCLTVECYEVLEGGDPCADSPIVIINNLDESELTCTNPVITLEANGTGGNGVLIYVWSLGDLDDSIIEVTEAGTYSVIVTDENGCTAEASVEVTQDANLPIALLSSTPETTGGAADGTATVEVDGNVTIEWTNAAGDVISTDATVTDLAPGEYCVQVIDTNNGCATEECIEVFEGDDPCINFSVIAETTAVLCAGDSNGSADVEVSGGTGPFNVSLNGLPITSFTGNTFTTPAILPAGSTIVQIEDANGCVVDVELEIDEPDEVEVAVTSTTETSPGTSDGTASAIGSGGTGSYLYTWDNGETTAEINGLVAGEYCVTVTDENDCSTESCVEITQGADPCEDFEVFLSSSDVTCFGGTDGSAGIETSGSTVDLIINWSNGATGFHVDLPAGTYSVEVIDFGCSETIEFEITEPDALAVNVTSTNESSIGAADGTADANVTGGTSPYTFTWSGSNSFNSTTEDISDLETGSYCLVVTDANGCESEEFCIEVESGADPCLGFEASLSTTDVLCNGENTGVAVVELQNGTLPYTYDWSSGTSSTSTNSDLAAGIITVIITDANDCQVELEGIIEEPTQLQVEVANVTAETDTGAGDGSIEIEISGGVLPYDLQWSNGEVGEELDNLPCGTYSVTVSDGNGCTVETTATVPCEDLGCESLQADVQVEPVSCFGDIDGQIEIFPSGGQGPYEVSLNSGQSGTSINNLPASLYVVIVVDANGCEYTTDVTVPSPAELETEIFETDGLCGAMAIAQVIPFGGTAPYTIEWSTGATTGVISNLDSGTYTVTITDANNCIATSLATVENIFEPIEFDVQIGHVNCNGDNDGFINVEVLTGQGPFTYEWSNGSTNPELFDLPAGKYTLVITDGNGCEYALSRDIIQPNAIQMDYVVSQGGTSTTFDVTLNVSGGTAPYFYDWDDGSNSIVNTAMQVGSYTVTIRDDRGCEETFEVLIDGSLTGIASLEILESFKVYPNPTQDQIYFIAELSEYAKLDIAVYNVLGQLILQDKAEGLQIKKAVDLSKQAVGTYYLQVGNERGQVVEKIIKID